ncbi:MAG: N-acetyltransferase [Siphonobacter aquaeclarae]|nr:N-acetyltransferase [Siphonobacter aquaeclarae]
MKIQITRTSLSTVAPMRALFLQQGGFQFVHDKCHRYGWADTWLVEIDGETAGYGSVWGRDERGARDTVFEFYLKTPFRNHASRVFSELLYVTGVPYLECQTNDTLLSAMVLEFGKGIEAEAILFADDRESKLIMPEVQFGRQRQSDDADHGGYCLQVGNEERATGGFLTNYNFPYADLYMDVPEPFRRQGYGSYFVQELKKEIYRQGYVPSARCNVRNTASRATLLKAGFRVCGMLLNGDVRR